MRTAFVVCFIILLTKLSYPQYSPQVAFPNLSFSYPVELTHAYDGTNRLFVVTQRGRIYVFPNNPGTTQTKIFLDISDRASQSGSETGLLGLAFHPNYENNRYFYVNYTTQQAPLRSRISRFQTSASNPDSAIANSELILIELAQPYSNHNGGCLGFGPDGYLYISFGDGGSGGDPQNNAQNRSVLLGKILRINVDSASGNNNYSIPPSNPFYNNSQGWRQEIFTWGMRNMWKFSFDLPTGRVWGADVGQGLYEEIDIIQSGKNYGWRIMEGFHCYNPPTGCDTSGLTMPLWEYDHSQGASITGGYVYRGPSVTSLTGKYIYADYISGRTWALTWDGINTPVNELLFQAGFLISTFGIDQNNELYLCSYSSAGQIYKITGSPIGIPPNEGGVPSGFFLRQNYPNPFNPVTVIGFTVPAAQEITLKIYNSLGREIQTLVNGYFTAGSHEVKWDASNYPSGIYIYKLTSGDYAVSKTMTLIK
jgi:hypothetical protein